MKKLIALILPGLFLVSCQTYDHGHGLSALAAATSGALAWKMTEGKSPEERLLWSAGAAGGTFALGQHVRSRVMESQKEQYELGYQSAMADASKRQYEIIQNRQKEDLPQAPYKYFIYEFPGVESRNGVNFAPHTVKLRVME